MEEVSVQGEWGHKSGLQEARAEACIRDSNTNVTVTFKSQKQIWTIKKSHGASKDFYTKRFYF